MHLKDLAVRGGEVAGESGQQKVEHEGRCRGYHQHQPEPGVSEQLGGHPDERRVLPPAGLQAGADHPEEREVAPATPAFLDAGARNLGTADTAHVVVQQDVTIARAVCACRAM